MRSKEDAKDYRYFPDPDLPPIHISDAWIEELRTSIPELREAKMERYQKEYELPAYDAGILTESRHLAGLFEETAVLLGNPKKVANWFMVEVLRLMKEKGIEAEKLRFTPQHLADLLTMVDKNYFNEEQFKMIPESIKEELHIICVLFTEEVGGVFTIAFEEDGNVVMETNADDDDIYYDEVSSGLLIAEIRRSRQELFESLSLYYRVFIKKEDVSELLDEEDGE